MPEMKDVTNQVLFSVHPDNIPIKISNTDIYKIEEGRLYLYFYYRGYRNNFRIYRKEKEKIIKHIKKPTENTVGEEIRNFCMFNLDFYQDI
jgi:hypothetical protein